MWGGSGHPWGLRRAAGQWLLAVTGSCLLLAACGGKDDGAPASASAVIGAAGGAIDGPDGVRVEIPPGALDAPTEIRVARSDAGAPAAFPADVTHGAVYEFTPHGIHFAEPVTLSMPSSADPAVLPVFMASPGGEWRTVSAAAAGGRVRWQVTGFSWATQGDACRIPAGNTDPFLCVWPSSFGTLNAVPAPSLVNVSASADFPDYTLTQEATVNVRFHYAAARDCGDVRAEITRWKTGVVDAGGKLIVRSVKTQASTSLPPSTTSTSRGEDDIVVPVPFAHADNGVHFFGMGFSCLRPGQTQRAVYGGQLRLSVETPTPSGPALPTISQQPAPASARDGAAVAFDVLASAANNLSITWEQQALGSSTWSALGSGITITGGSRLVLTALLADNGAQFRAQVCNSLNAQTACVASAAADLTVTPAPSAASLSVLAGALNATGNVDGTGSAARFDTPGPIALDTAGNAYIVGAACTLRKLTPAGVVTTLAGLAGACTSADGSGSAARFHFPSGVAVDAAGNLYVAENFGAIRKVTPAGVVSTLAGADMTQDFVDGPGATARFSTPGGLAIDAGGNLYLADRGNHAIRKIDPAGNVSTLVSGDANGNPVIDGPVGTATLYQPNSLVVDAAGTVYFTEFHLLRKLEAGVVTTLAGSLADVSGYLDATGLAARFNNLGSITRDPTGDLYAIDAGNHVIRKITSAGAVSTVLGAAGQTDLNLTSTPPHIGFSAYGLVATGVGQFLLSSHPVVLKASVP
jgi:hypothetical protein